MTKSLAWQTARLGKQIFLLGFNTSEIFFQSRMSQQYGVYHLTQQERDSRLVVTTKLWKYGRNICLEMNKVSLIGLLACSLSGEEIPYSLQ